VPSDIHVTDDAAARRYEISVDGRRAGFATYRWGEDVIAFVHTEIDPDVQRHPEYGDLVTR
jgi:uncharacterized protein